MTQENNIEIIEVQNRAQLMKFVRFPTWLYEGNKFYVPSLDLDEIKMFTPKNPSWEQVDIKMFLALNTDPNNKIGLKYGRRRVVGRIAVMVQKVYNEKNGVNFARFTRLDFIDDKNVARALLDAACDFVRGQGMDTIHGPLGFNDLDKEGLLVEGFNKLSTFAESYNYAYYKTYLEDYGFQKEVDWLEFLVKLPERLEERVLKISDRMRQRLKLHFLPKKISIKKTIKQYGNEVIALLNTCYTDLHGVIPITDKVREDILKQFKQVIRHEHVCIVFNENDVIVGFGLTAPNISRSLHKSKGRICNFGFIPWNGLRIKLEARKPKYVDLCLVAVAPEYRGKGVNAMIMNELHASLTSHGITEVETNLQLEDNVSMVNMFEGFERELIKRRRCYILNLPKNEN